MVARIGSPRLRARVLRWGGCLLVLCASACSTRGGKPAETASAEAARRDTKILHEPCDLNSASAEKHDVNRDGRADLTIVRNGKSEVCRGVDLNFDGVIDAWVYKDKAGKERRRESDFDRDGRIDEVAIYQAGELVEKRRATSLAGRFDTWHFFKHGELVRTERDADGNSFVDQWWEYAKDRSKDCPLIHSDVDGDGKPDPGATVDVCQEDEYAPAPMDDAEASAPGAPEAEPAPQDAPPAAEDVDEQPAADAEDDGSSGSATELQDTRSVAAKGEASR